MSGVVICGGGVIGAAAAYYLSLHDRTATIIERRSLASGASGSAAGLLSPPAPSDLLEPSGRLAQQGLDLHFDLAKELDGRWRYGFEPLEMALVARTEKERKALLQAFPSAEWLAPPALRARCPWVDGKVAGGIVRDGGAQLDPLRFTRTLVAASGATVVAGAVEGVRFEGTSVAAILTSVGEFETEDAIIAMGPWSNEAAAWLGAPVPVGPLKGQILRMDVPGAPPGGFADMDGNYLVRKPFGLVYTGTTEEDAGFDESPTGDAEARILATNGRLASLLGRAKLVQRTACLRPLSQDGVPIIGPVPGREHLFIATGHGRKGMIMSPATGKALAELIVHGRSTSLDLSPFAPSRFAGDAERTH